MACCRHFWDLTSYGRKTLGEGLYATGVWIKCFLITRRVKLGQVLRIWILRIGRLIFGELNSS